MQRKLFSRDADDENDETIDFDMIGSTPFEAAPDMASQMIKNMNSEDEGMREMAMVSIANLSSEMEPEFYQQFLMKPVLVKLTETITDSHSQVCFNSLTAIQRLVSLSRVHKQSALLEAGFLETQLVSVVVSQMGPVVNKVKENVSEILSKKETLRRDGLTKSLTRSQSRNYSSASK